MITVPGPRESATGWPLAAASGPAGIARRLRAFALRGLTRMYRQDEQSFVFRLRWRGGRVISEGFSRRYTAIVLIGLAADAEREAVLSSRSLQRVCARLIGRIGNAENLGDVALAVWAAGALRHPDREAALKRLRELRPETGPRPVVELAWALDALCLDEMEPAADLRAQLARRLIASFHTRSAMFPHVVGADGAGLRSHVSCFADLVYPVQALARHFVRSGDRRALDVALRCARRMCSLQGAAGQWWWHYDSRTGAVIERYPVYAVHQDAMAPMALFALQDASGVSFDAEIGRGLAWLAHAPELSGGSLIDEAAGLVWRKVARREPWKLSRRAQAAASRIHASLRVPGLDTLFPARTIDREDRPYHLGWLLHAWPVSRVERWDAAAVSR
jgi:hypothetical protein